MDALRGIFLLGMICVHFIYDLGNAYNLEYHTLFISLMQWGGTFFLLLSGICVTLGSHPIRRGILVFACGMLCSAATAALFFTGLAQHDILIYFGVLHCLGVCMLLWPVFSKLPVWGLCAAGIVISLVGLYLNTHVQVNTPWLVPLGILCPGFASSDYFPVLPNLGFFLLGAFSGRILYRNRTTLFPKVNAGFLPLRFVCFLGRQSLFFYLLHQPVLIAAIWLIQHFHR